MFEMTTKLPFPTILNPLRVPTGYYPIEVVQFSRGMSPEESSLPLHWALAIRTSADRGSCHEIVGDMHSYATQDRFNVSLKKEYQRDDWRGSHVVGYVSPNRLGYLLYRIAFIRVVRHQATWNCQNWVYEVLEGLRYVDVYADATMTFAMLQTHMSCLSEALEIGEI